jgi:hypothetical protein
MLERSPLDRRVGAANVYPPLQLALIKVGVRNTAGDLNAHANQLWPALLAGCPAIL